MEELVKQRRKEVGRSLEALTGHPGWKDLLAIKEEYQDSKAIEMGKAEPFDVESVNANTGAKIVQPYQRRMAVLRGEIRGIERLFLEIATLIKEGRKDEEEEFDKGKKEDAEDDE